MIVTNNEVLRQVSKDPNRREDLPALEKRMRKAMAESGGIGLAAIQIGKPIRAVLVQDKFLVSPTIVSGTGKAKQFNEGCLSVPGIRVLKKRVPKVKIHYFDTSWKEHTKVFRGLEAAIVQHEIDHLNGVLISDT